MGYTMKNAGKNFNEFDLTPSHGAGANYAKTAQPGDSPNKGFLKTLLNPVGALVKKVAPNNKFLNTVANPLDALKNKFGGGGGDAAATATTDATSTDATNAVTPDPNAIAAVPQPEVDPNAQIA